MDNELFTTDATKNKQPGGRNSTLWLSSELTSPVSNAVSLTSEASAVCVIPTEGRAFVSADLRHYWAELQEVLSRTGKAGLRDISYSNLTQTLQSIWKTPAPPTALLAPLQRRPKDNETLYRMKNQRRTPSSERKERGKTRHVSRLNAVGTPNRKRPESTLNSVYTDDELQTNSQNFIPTRNVFVSPVGSTWTVVRHTQGSTDHMMIRGERVKKSKYLARFNLLPPFKLPVVPDGMEVVEIYYPENSL